MKQGNGEAGSHPILERKSMGFLPQDYKEPSSGNNRYLRLQKDETVKIRILGSFEDSTGIMGWQGWITQDDGSRKPMRGTEEEKGTFRPRVRRM